MKKILLSFLMLGIILTSPQVFSATYTYEFGYSSSDPFDENDWSPMFGSSWSWNSPPNFYIGSPSSQGSIAASSVASLPDLFSTGIFIETVFSAVAGNNAGIFFGDYNGHKLGVFEGADNSIWLDLNLFGFEDQIELEGIYLNDLFWLQVFVDFENTLFWNVSQRDLDAGGAYVSIGAGFYAGLPVLTGDVGVFAETDGARFAAFYVEGDDENPVPVPAAIWLFASGLLGLVGLKRRQK